PLFHTAALEYAVVARDRDGARWLLDRRPYADCRSRAHAVHLPAQRHPGIGAAGGHAAAAAPAVVHARLRRRAGTAARRWRAAADPVGSADGPGAGLFLPL